MVPKVFLLTGMIALLGVATPAMAEYAEECRELADKLARDPGALKAGEIDLLKNCMAGLQRSIALSEKIPPSPPPPAAECPPVAPAPVCPPCAPAAICPKQSPAPSAKDRPRDREPAVDLLRPQLQKF